MNKVELGIYRVFKNGDLDFILLNNNVDKFFKNGRRIEKIEDLWACIGLIINILPYATRFTRLEYYSIIDKGPDYFERYLNNVIEAGGIIAKFESVDHIVKYIIKVEEVKRK